MARESLMSLMAVGLLMAEPALACPICDSGTGQQVRAGIWDGAFLRNLAAVLAPFGAFAGIAAIIHLWPAPLRLRRSAQQPAEKNHGA